MNYEQCIEYVKAADGPWLTWIKICLPILVSTLTVFLTYYLTTRKEKSALIANKLKARQADPAAWLLLNELLAEGRTVKDWPSYRDLMSNAKGICEYCEKASDDVYHYTNIQAYNRFSHLKRIAYHYRDELERFSKIKDFMEALTNNNKPLSNLEYMSDDVKGRMDAYCDQYGTDGDGQKDLAWIKKITKP
jgi:hypothetical protein